MKVTLVDAYKLLKLPYGASLEEVVDQYKCLAAQLRPSHSLKEFEEVTCAFKRITTPGSSDEIDMDMETMKDIFKNIIYGSSNIQNGNGIIVDEDSDESDYSYEYSTHPSQKQSDQLAKELISEEEKEKRKAEKRRAKKKKRREKKKLEKEQEHLTNNKNNTADARNDTPNGMRSSDEGEGIDPNAAFVRKSNKRKPEATSTASTKTDNNSSLPQQSAAKKNDSSDPGESANVVTKQSRFIANKGNEAAHAGDYPSAIQHFTDAIKLEPSDYRFYGNRSYCYDRIMQFEKALSDAEKCIELSPEWPKGYFRKGRALAGLKLFQDAEKAFTQVLKLDRTCEEATKELNRVRTQQLIDMGFSPRESEHAVLSKNSLQQALDYLLTGVGAELSIQSTDIYMSDDYEEDDDTTPSDAVLAQQIPQAVVKSKVKTQSNHNRNEALIEEKKMDPTNPHKLTALWVGNVLPTVKDTDLQSLFSRYGHVSSVRCLPEKYCAFVNFKSTEAAGKAMNALQNHEVQGQRLLIKFPDNPIANGLPLTKLIKTGVASLNPKQDKRVEKSLSGVVTAAAGGQKVSGPVNGDECYFWRTTGCQFGAKCRWNHIPESKGIDKKPWQRVK